MKELKEYTVNIDMHWSTEYIIKAPTEAEAKQKAWEKFKKNPPKKDFEILADKR